VDSRHFDALVTALARLNSRRQLLTVLATLPVIGGLLGLFSEDEAAGKDRRRRRKQRHKRRKNAGSRKHKKNKKKCKPEPITQTCAGKCGTVTNNCKKRVNCGSCTCNPTCEVCFTCQDQGGNAPGACILDPAQQGEPCGSDGKVCQPDGSCACIPTTCADAGAACGVVDDGCGGALQCGTCGGNQLCIENTCAACDVCKDGSCAFTSVQAAIDASAQPATIYVCPGSYAESATGLGAVRILNPLTLIGAGDGDDPTTSTILTPVSSNEPVVYVETASPVILQGLRISGGTGLNGIGCLVNQSGVEFTGCTIANNISDVPGGGISIVGGITQVTLTDTRVTGNTGNSAGGIEVDGNGAKLTLDTLSRVTGNTATSQYGGIRANSGSTVELPSADNVTNNPNFGAFKNCGGPGDYTGPGAVCTTT
jgi:hypothetical protein